MMLGVSNEVSKSTFNCDRKCCVYVCKRREAESGERRHRSGVGAGRVALKETFLQFLVSKVPRNRLEVTVH